MTEPQNLPTIRTSAKAVVIHNGRVLLQRATWEGMDCYFLPGGGQHPGEPLDAAARREVHEETGLTVHVVRMLWLREYIGANHEHADTEADTHRVEAIFHCTPEGTPGQLSGHAKDDLQTGLEWVELEKVSGLNLLPHALRQPIAALAVDDLHIGYLGDVA
ncbi:NUDIX domain-containing protein [Micromonospora polyrhachis]|uniref:ADP-ribose pyrophosphatase YjhB (NUDIX family) n=1 Tax=Micromonospora polyrhachis TaxID=1282883 RepID=A0A7W7WQH1_9ACTN|nr:NUDIX domain-containing protein [Micromonospora polyrhachis]MBB4960271.1 ADP-ribose pyrophosphatase YjhB (NUDIX family) [Micromonospora polyrhachis]